VTGLGDGQPPAVRALAAEAWAFRWRVECEAEVRFDRLARRLEGLGRPPALVELARRASADERRHAAHCARLAAALGSPAPESPPPAPPAVAPAGLPEEEAVTYELTAASCLAESLSVAVLTALLPEARHPELRAVLHELAEDEVGHARLGWANLAIAAARGRSAFLGPHLPAMLRGSLDEVIFSPGGPSSPPRRDHPFAEDAGLLALGVLPLGRRRELLASALTQVVFPGLDGAGVATGAGRAWLEDRLGAEG